MGGLGSRVGRGDPGDVSHDAGCLVHRAVSVGRGAAVLWIVEVAVSGRARRVGRIVHENWASLVYRLLHSYTHVAQPPLGASSTSLC